MSSIGSPSPFFLAGKKAYQVERSLRFNSGDVTYLTRTPSSSGNRRTMTYSFWLKKCKPEAFQTIVSGATDSSNRNQIDLLGTGGIRVWGNSSGSQNVYVAPSNLLRDTSAWYHIVVAIDTTQGTSSNRVKFYFNGVQATSYSNTTYPSQNAELNFNKNVAQSFGLSDSGPDVYFAEINFIDGQQLTPSSFGETDAITGQWNPKKYVGSYGTNGYYLNFSDNSGTTATTLGKDSSGNGNNFTPNNFSVSAGAGNDSVEDTPTNNFPTINPLDGGSNALLTNGNLTFKANSSNSGNFNAFYSSFAMRSGKWYMEVTIVNQNSGSNSIQFGIASYKYKRDSTNQNGYPGTSGLTFINTNNSNSGSRKGVVDGSAIGSSISLSATNDVYGVAFDADNKKVYFYKNGSAEGESSGYNVTDVGTGDFFFFATLRYSTGSGYSGGDSTLAINYGQRAFSYTPPTGYKALCSANLPDPTILLPNKHFGTLLYSAGSSNGTFTFTDSTAVDFLPNWTWIKCRTAGENHYVMDSVRGNVDIDSASDSKWLIPNSNLAEGNGGGSLAGTTVSSIQNGIKIVETSIGSGEIYFTNRNYVTWNWNAGATDGKTYTVKVVSDGGNKYRFDDFGTSAVTLDLAEGGTYIFDGSDSSMASHPIKLSETSNGTHGGGSSYNTGVTYLLDGASVTESAYVSGYASATTRQLKIVVAASAPTLYYYCHYHSGMGGQANTNSTLGSSNFDGSIQSTAKVNQTAGFSIVTYTGNATSGATVGHGLGVAPKVFIVKERGNANNWTVYHQSLGSTGSGDTYVLFLDLNSDKGGGFAGGFNNTAPTSSVFSLGNSIETNRSSGNFITYCFSEVAGYSKFGSYTGNGSSDGTFVFTGFRPAWVMLKRSSSGVFASWAILDNKRDPVNVTSRGLFANSTTAEASSTLRNVDFLSNGFKLKTNHNNINGSGGEYIYLAFSESPFKNARAR